MDGKVVGRGRRRRASMGARGVWFAGALLCWPGSAPAQLAAPEPALRLGPGDGIRLVVENEPDLAADYPVGPDGRVLLPLVGGVTVAGQDFSDVEEEIRRALSRELAPGLEVQVTPIFRMAVLGEVRTPGLLSVDPTMRVADVLAMAGGFSPSADRDRIQLLRDGRVLIETDEDGLTQGALVLRPGDRLLVGRRGWLRENLGVVIGAAGSLAVAVITGLIVR